MYVEKRKVCQDGVDFFNHPNLLFFFVMRFFFFNGNKVWDPKTNDKKGLIRVASSYILPDDLIVNEVSFEVKNKILFSHFARSLKLHLGSKLLIMVDDFSGGFGSQWKSSLRDVFEVLPFAIFIKGVVVKKVILFDSQFPFFFLPFSQFFQGQNIWTNHNEVFKEMFSYILQNTFR